MAIRFATGSLKFLALTITSCILLLGQAYYVIAENGPFFQGKTIRIIVGFTSGGLYDQYARILARQMPQYIPGNPTIIVQNMPGGSLTATSHVPPAEPEA